MLGYTRARVSFPSTQIGRQALQRVTVTMTGGAADVRLSRPEKRNVLDLRCGSRRASGDSAGTACGCAVRRGPRLLRWAGFRLLPGDACGQPVISGGKWQEIFSAIWRVACCSAELVGGS
jgi:hypothetical protein